MRDDAVSVVLASAGTGKTHHLTGALAERLIAGEARPEGVIAITYTRKAAHELAARARQRLLASGRADLATRIRDGAIGTVHGICDRLLREFALDVGLSPDLDIATEEVKRRLLARATNDITGNRSHVTLDACARRLGIKDWREIVSRIVDLARSNRLTPEAITASADRSAADVVALLDARADDPTYLQDLKAAGSALGRRLQRERSAAAGDRRHLLERLNQPISRGEIPPWPDQIKLEREIASQRKYDPEGPALAAVVARHLAHPALHADLTTMIRETFELASRALDGFAEEKRRARVIDYEDMLGLTVDLLAQPHVAAVLSERFDLLLVDEFQDTSPLQLSLILKLADLCGRTLWVGDPKQAIFGFQGADPELTIRAMAGAPSAVTPETVDAEPTLVAIPPPRAASVLRTSYRSRPALVRLVSSVFDAAFAPHGLATDGLRAARTEPPELADEPALELAVWWTDNANTRRDEAEGVAATVTELLEDARVSDRDTGAVRRAVPGDIAVIMRFNADIQRVAAALERRGIAVRVARGRLLDEPEIRCARAALALLVDPTSGVAAMELSWLGGGAGDDPDAWLSGELPDPATPGRAPFAEDRRVAAVRALVPSAQAWSPLDALDRVLAATELVDLVRGWSDAPRRLGNLEAFRAEVRAYTDACRVDRTVATIVGLLVWLDERARAEKDHQAGRPVPVPQAVPTDAEAVTVSTLHGAKGLEWPIVVLGTLGWRPGPPIDQPTVVPAPSFDPAQPLAGRWVRWWPCPVGAKEHRQSLYVTRAKAHPSYTADAARDAREQLRLMYVGFTRARDRLVLALGNRRGRWERDMLGLLADGEGQAVLHLPLPEQDPAVTGLEDLALESAWTDEGWGPPDDEPAVEVKPLSDVPERAPERHATVARVGGTDPHDIPCLVRRVSTMPPPRSAPRRPGAARFAALPRPPSAIEAVRPSSLALSGPLATRRGEIVPLPGAIPTRPAAGVRADALGDAIHAFFAGDQAHQPAADRLADAAAQLAAHDVADALPPITIVRAADALKGWLDARWPAAVHLHEWPVRWRLQGDRLLTGEIDLVLDTTDGLVVIDHKSFPGDADERDRRVAEYAPQLAAYALVLERATGRPVLGTWLHFPLRGEAVEVIVDRRAVEAELAPGDPPVAAAPARASRPNRSAKEPPPGQLSLFAPKEA